MFELGTANDRNKRRSKSRKWTTTLGSTNMRIMHKERSNTQFIRRSDGLGCIRCTWSFVELQIWGVGGDDLGSLQQNGGALHYTLLGPTAEYEGIEKFA